MKIAPMPNTSEYDPITLNHWLWFKYLCHEGSPNDFQRLFENIMKRAKPEFMQIRPYGNIGDRKADGLLIANSTIFQVYSPDTLTQAEVIKKINEDLEGAVTHWREHMKKWVFVYNVRRGIPPDIPKILMEKQKQYEQITIEPMSSDALWEIARDLPVQKRAEVLGAPSGHENMFLIPDKALVPNTVAEATDKAWIVLIQDVLDPVDVHSILTALSPEIPVGAPIFIRPDTSSWEEAGEYQRQLIADIFAKCRHSVPPRFAVFSIAPIPLIVHLGFLLAYNVPVRYYKLHIDTQSWKWPEVALQAVDENIQVNGVPQETILERSEVLIRISLSAFVGQHETDEVAPGLAAQIDIFVDKPNRTWIRSPKQLDRLSEVFRGVLDEIRQKVPYCQRIHLFCAIPAPAALAIGRQINPRMDPPVSLYEYSRQKSPRYELALTLSHQEA